MVDQSSTEKSSFNTTGLPQLERRMYIAFGVLNGLMTLAIMLFAGAYFHFSLSRAQDDLSTFTTRILSESVRKISFSGIYQTRLLLEDIKKQHPDILYLLVANPDGVILAHSDPLLNDTRLDQASWHEATRVLQGSPREIRHLVRNGAPIREITLPYYAGFGDQSAGVIQVGLADHYLLDTVIRSGWLALLLGSSLLAVGLTLGFLYINRHFISPVRLMASQLEGILDNSPNIMSIRNRQGDLIACSTSFKQFFGHRLVIEDGQYTALYTPEEAAVLNRHLEQVSEQNKPVQFELTVPDLQGGKREWLVSSFPIVSEKGEVLQIGSIVVDLTDLRTAEAALRRSLEEARQASAAKSEFLSHMSHELRTPLNAIIGFSQVLQQDTVEPLSPAQHDSVNEILRAGRHLLDLINEILDLARIESGHMEMTLEVVPVAKLFEACIQLIRPLADQRGICLVPLPRCADADYTCRLLCDPLRTRQVLLNLLSNAVKYNRDNGSIALGCQRTKEGFCRILVQDTGNGVDPAFLPKLFEPFSRAVLAVSGVEGTGIGLALAKRLVEAMGGEIGVESTPGVGSLFWFELPVSGPQQAEAAPDQSGQEPALTPASASGRYTILSVEDDPTNQHLIQKVIAASPQFTLLAAGTAEEGLELVRTTPVDLILMDINLPGMDGFEALATLRCSVQTARIPVIAVSANAMQSEIDDALAAGFAAYLVKPLDIDRLLQEIDHCLSEQKEGTA